MLVLYLKSMGFKEGKIGALFALTVIDDAGIFFFMTTRADVFGRRKMLKLARILKSMTGVVFCFTQNFSVLVLAATFGVISPSSKEIGPFLSIEHVSLSQIMPSTSRTRVFAWHNLLGNYASAIGDLVSDIMFLMDGPRNMSDFNAYRCIMAIYGICGGLLFLLFSCLSESVEVPSGLGHVVALYD